MAVKMTLFCDTVKVYFVERGVVELLLPQRAKRHNTELEGEEDPFIRISKVSFGGIFGDVSFFLSSGYG